MSPARSPEVKLMDQALESTAQASLERRCVVQANNAALRYIASFIKQAAEIYPTPVLEEALGRVRDVIEAAQTPTASPAAAAVATPAVGQPKAKTLKR